MRAKIKSKIYILLYMLFLSLGTDASDFGTKGIIDVPSARMRPDASFTSTIALQDRTRAYSISYQAFPWLEATFRYTGFNDFKLYDRNYELKLNLLKESSILPEVSVGIRDLVGTGVFGAEYLVASKRINNFDLTLGMGWGRLAGNGDLSNPFKLVSNKFNTRDVLVEYESGGTFADSQFFRGNKVGIFGGLEYRFEDNPITLMVERNPDNFAYDRNYGGPASDSEWSYGLKWHVSKNVDLSFTRQNGQDFGITLNASLDTSTKPIRKKPPAIISSIDIEQKDLPKGINKASWYDRLLYDVERSGAFLIAGEIIPGTERAELVVANKDYQYWPDALAKIHQLAEIQLPSTVSQVNYTIEENGHNVITVQMPLSRNFGDLDQSVALLQKKSELLPPKNVSSRPYSTNFVKEKVGVDLTLQNRLMLFDPDNPFAYQFYLKAASSVELPNRWNVKFAYGLNLYNNFGDLSRVSDSVLPHVRSDMLQYLKKGKSGLDSLFIEKRGSAGSGVHFRTYAGVLEEMYSGVGGEVLYQPHQSRLAFGVSANWVKQRGFKKDFSHRNYSTSTAFASIYWASPYSNYDVAFHAGRYLAKDIGGTVEVRRTFDNGWMVGLWATLTDVPFEKFGEGSFDKGIYLRIPFDILSKGNTRASYNAAVRPILRDGGARLESFSGNLWWDIRAARYDVFRDMQER